MRPVDAERPRRDQRVACARLRARPLRPHRLSHPRGHGRVLALLPRLPDRRAHHRGGALHADPDRRQGRSAAARAAGRRPAFANRGYGRGLVANALDAARAAGIALVCWSATSPTTAGSASCASPSARSRCPAPSIRTGCWRPSWSPSARRASPASSPPNALTQLLHPVELGSAAHVRERHPTLRQPALGRSRDARPELGARPSILERIAHQDGVVALGAGRQQRHRALDQLLDRGART